MKFILLGQGGFTHDDRKVASCPMTGEITPITNSGSGTGLPVSAMG